MVVAGTWRGAEASHVPWAPEDSLQLRCENNPFGWISYRAVLRKLSSPKMDQFVVVSHMAHWPELITHSTAAYAKLVTGLQGVAHGHKSNF